MRKIVIVVSLLLIAAASGVYYRFYYPPNLFKRTTQQTLNDFGAVLATRDQTKINAALSAFLTDTAHIRLTVEFASVNQNAKTETEDFSKPEFISFIGNILYSLKQFSFTAQVKRFSLAPDRLSAMATFEGTSSGEGDSYYAGTSFGIRYKADTVCDSEIVFKDKHALLDKADCKLLLRSALKAGDEKKLGSPDAINDLLH